MEQDTEPTHQRLQSFWSHTESTWFLDIITGEAGALCMQDYEGEYMGESEKIRVGHDIC